MDNISSLSGGRNMSSQGGGTMVQGYQQTETSEQSGTQMQAYQPAVEATIDSALSLFAAGQIACIRANDDVVAIGGDLVIDRKRVDELRDSIDRRRNELLTSHDWERYGRTNEAWRDAKLELLLTEEEDFAAWNDECDELTHRVRLAVTRIEALTNTISIGKRQMDFATALLGNMAK